MRVGIFDPYLDDLGGGEKYMMTIAGHLSKKHIVDVFWDNKQDIEKVAERFSLNLDKVNLVDNIFAAKYPFLKKLKDSLKYDAIIILSDGSLPLLLSKKTFIHFQQPMQQVIPSITNALKLKKISKIFCNSKFTKSFIDREFNINSEVLYPPVEINNMNLAKENIILNVGRLRINKQSNTEFKKQSVLIDAFRKMVDKGLKDWQFILAVSIKKEDELILEKIKQHVKGYPVSFLVNQPNQKLWEEYGKAKIYWHASGFGEDLSSHPELAEHFGISTVEAMGAGVVPVVINAGGQKEIVENDKSGYLWDNLNDLEELTLKLINNSELMSKMSKSAKETSQRFNKEKFEKQVDNLIS